MSLLCVMHCVEHQRALFNLTLKSAYEAGSIAVRALNCVRHFVTPWTVVHQVPVSVEFSRQEYWNGLPFHIQTSYKQIFNIGKIILIQT